MSRGARQKALFSHISLVHPTCVLMCRDQLAEIPVCRELVVSKSQRWSSLSWSAQQCYGGRKHYFAQGSASASFLHRIWRSQGLQEGPPNNTVSLPWISLSWSLIETVFLIGEGKNVVQILYEKIVQVIIFIGTTENYFCVFVLPLLALLVLLKEVRENFAMNFSGSTKDIRDLDSSSE